MAAPRAPASRRSRRARRGATRSPRRPRRGRDEAIRLGRCLLARDRLREPVYRALMQLHARRGERTEALKLYAACREALKQDLGVAPDARTEDLYRDILTDRLPCPRPWPRPSGRPTARRSRCCPSAISAAIPTLPSLRRHYRRHHYRPRPISPVLRDRSSFVVGRFAADLRRGRDRAAARCRLSRAGQPAAPRRRRAHHRATHRRRQPGAALGRSL